MRRCKNCGRYFAIQIRSTAEYCDRVIDERGRTCKDVGAIALWTKSKKTDTLFNDYRGSTRSGLPEPRSGSMTRRAFILGARWPERRWSSAGRKRSRSRNFTSGWRIRDSFFVAFRADVGSAGGEYRSLWNQYGKKEKVVGLAHNIHSRLPLENLDGFGALPPTDAKMRRLQRRFRQRFHRREERGGALVTTMDLQNLL